MEKTLSLTRKEAEAVLQDVPADNEFILRDGTRLKNLHGLSIKLSVLSDEEFGFHVNDQKNDFKAWINDVINDKVLAKELTNSKNRKEMKAAIDAKIRLCRSVIHEKALSKKKELNPISEPPARDQNVVLATNIPSNPLPSKGKEEKIIKKSAESTDAKGFDKEIGKGTENPSPLDLSIEDQAKTLTPIVPEQIPHDSLKHITHSFLNFLLGLCLGIILGVIITRLAL